MKRLWMVSAMLGMGLVVGGVYAQSGPSSAQQQINAAGANMGRAAKAHDAKGFMAAFRRGPELVSVNNGMVIHGWNAVYAQQLKWWHNGKSDVVYKPTGPTEFMQLAPGVWVTTMTMSSRRTGSDGRVAIGTFAVTAIWRKFAEGWRIVYSHESWAKP